MCCVLPESATRSILIKDQPTILFNKLISPSKLFEGIMELIDLIYCGYCGSFTLTSQALMT